MGFTITVQELKQRLDQVDKIVLVDVREPWEYATAKIEGAILIPLATIAIIMPLLVGLILGVEALGGFLAGVILSGQLLAVFMANGGGAWDNSL